MFVDIFENQQDVFSSFRVSDKDAAGVTILFAAYTYEDYSGNALVLFEKDGKLYEVNGSHCSCYGLEDQWEPEETFEQAILHRVTNGRLGYGSAADAHLKQLMQARLERTASSEA